MKKILFIAVPFIFMLGCRKQVDNISLTEQNKNSPLNGIDNIAFTKNNGLFISGVFGHKYTLVKTDPSLNIQWIKNDYEWGNFISASGWGAHFYGIKIVKVFERNDGSYVCIGAISEGGDVVFSSALIIVLDKNGNQLQKYRFDDLMLWNALKTDDGYVLFGTQLIKLDNNFNKLWTTPIYNNATYFPDAITATTDRGFAITGSNGDQIYLEKLDANGNEVFTKTYKHNDYPFEESGFDITQLEDGGFLIAGRTGDATASSNIINCQMIRTDSMGDTTWTKRFGYPTNSWIDHIVSNSQNELVLKGSIGYPGDNIQKNMLIKVNSKGEILNTKITDVFPLIVYSPLNVYIKATGDGSGGIKLSVINADDLFN